MINLVGILQETGRQSFDTLQAKGPLEIVSGTGRTLNKVEETYLCRCGASKNKPYCDGSHKAMSFTAP